MKDNKLTIRTKNRIGQLIMKTTIRIDHGKKLWKKKFYKKFLSCIHKSYFPVVNYEAYVELVNKSDYKYYVIKSHRKGMAGLIQYYDDPEIPQKTLEVDLPDIRLLCFENCYIKGCSDVVVDLKANCVINEACYNKPPEAELIDGLLYRSSDNLCVLRDDFKNIEYVRAGVQMSGKLAHNYYHVIYENLIRILLLNECNIPMDVPLLVDEIVFKVPSFKKIFEILFDSVPQRPVMVLKSEQMYRFGTLYKFDSINKLTSHLNKIGKSRPQDFVYDQNYCELLRYTLQKKQSEETFSKRFFITRSKTAGRHCNEDEIVKVLQPYGFEVVSPQDYSFEEQMSLFAGAEWIVGSTGAAMSNLLFCGSNCKIICLGVCKKYYEPCIFNTIAYINGCKIWYVAPINDNKGHGFHSDFQVDIHAFSHRMKEIIEKES